MGISLGKKTEQSKTQIWDTLSMQCSFAGLGNCRIQHKGLLVISAGKACTAKRPSVQRTTSWLWMSLAAGPASLNGCCSAWPHKAAERLTWHHPSPGSALFQHLCTACTVLWRHTPGDPSVSADADLGTRDHLLHIKPRGSLLPLWLWLIRMNLTELLMLRLEKLVWSYLG